MAPYTLTWEPFIANAPRERRIIDVNEDVAQKVEEKQEKYAPLPHGNSEEEKTNNTAKKKKTKKKENQSHEEDAAAKQQARKAKREVAQSTDKQHEVDDDGGGFFDMFGGGGDGDEDKEEENKATNDAAIVPPIIKLKDDSCPFDDPRGKHVYVLYDGEKFGATIRSYEQDSNTYTITWLSSGILQYRTEISHIVWEEPIAELAEMKAKQVAATTTTAVAPQDELWLAARRGSLDSVKRFVAAGIDFNDTGKDQERTPFYLAVHGGHVQVAEYLLSLGAVDTDGTAFIAANKPEMRELLQRKGLTKTGSFSAPKTTTDSTRRPSRYSSMGGKRPSVVTQRQEEQQQTTTITHVDASSAPKRKMATLFSCLIPKLGNNTAKTTKKG